MGSNGKVVIRAPEPVGQGCRAGPGIIGLDGLGALGSGVDGRGEIGDAQAIRQGRRLRRCTELEPPAFRQADIVREPCEAAFG